MATLTTLNAPGGPLVRLRLRLDWKEFDERELYMTRELFEELKAELLQMTGASDFTPQQQLNRRFREWITGKPMEQGRMFRNMRPRTDGVFELKTPDLRLFGWMPAAKKLILARAGLADDYKPQTVDGTPQPPKKSYETEKAAVIAARDALPLDEPKSAIGDFDDLVG